MPEISLILPGETDTSSLEFWYWFCEKISTSSGILKLLVANNYPNWMGPNNCFVADTEKYRTIVQQYYSLEVAIGRVGFGFGSGGSGQFDFLEEIG
jgi:hypothetical protein